MLILTSSSASSGGSSSKKCTKDRFLSVFSACFRVRLGSYMLSIKMVPSASLKSCAIMFVLLGSAAIPSDTSTIF